MLTYVSPIAESSPPFPRRDLQKTELPFIWLTLGKRQQYDVPCIEMWLYFSQGVCSQVGLQPQP
jgi:hypothetical protein